MNSRSSHEAHTITLATYALNPTQQPSCHSCTGAVGAYRVAFHSDRLPRGCLVSREVAAEGVAHVVAIRVQIYRARGLLLEPGEQQLLQHSKKRAQGGRVAQALHGLAKGRCRNFSHMCRPHRQVGGGFCKNIEGNTASHAICTEGHLDATPAAAADCLSARRQVRGQYARQTRGRWRRRRSRRCFAGQSTMSWQPSLGASTIMRRRAARSPVPASLRVRCAVMRAPQSRVCFALGMLRGLTLLRCADRLSMQVGGLRHGSCAEVHGPRWLCSVAIAVPGANEGSR